MPVSYTVFEKFKDRGMAAYRAGDWQEARVYLLQSARAMTELAGDCDGELRDQREEMARKLLALANSCRERQARASRPHLEKASDESAGAGGGHETAASWIVRDKPTIGFDDIAGLDDVKEEIRLKMIYPVRHADLARRFGIARGGGILLYGPPGTGKTLIARAVAAEIDAAFFTVKPSQIMSKWVGEAEQNIQALFTAARAEPVAIIFIDEVEALVPARRDSQSGVMQRVVPQILAELEGFDRPAPAPPPATDNLHFDKPDLDKPDWDKSSDKPPAKSPPALSPASPSVLLFIAATNEPWSIDPAMLRPGRLDEKIYVGLPDRPARRRMLDLYLTGRPLAADVDLDALAEALDGYSGADIRNIANKAASLPFLASVADGLPREITSADIAEALRRTRPSVSAEIVARFETFRQLGTV